MRRSTQCIVCHKALSGGLDTWGDPDQPMCYACMRGLENQPCTEPVIEMPWPPRLPGGKRATLAGWIGGITRWVFLEQSVRKG